MARDGVSLADMYPRSIFMIELLLHEVVALTALGQMHAWGLTAQDLVGDSLQRCQEVVGVAARLGAEAIRWPSATGAGQSIAVFIDQLRPGSHADVVRSFDLTHDALKAIAAGASVTVLIPALKDTPLVE